MMNAIPGASGPIPEPLTPNPERRDPQTAANNRLISSAVRLLNDSRAAGTDHEFSIAIDPQTRQAIVRIVDLSTREVVEQLPSEYLLHVAQEISERLAKQSQNLSR